MILATSISAAFADNEIMMDDSRNTTASHKDNGRFILLIRFILHSSSQIKNHGLLIKMQRHSSFNHHYSNVLFYV